MNVQAEKAKEVPRSDKTNLAERLGKILVVAPSIRIMGGQAVVAKQLLDDFEREGIDVGFLPINPKPPGILAFAENIKYVRTVVVSFLRNWNALFQIPKYDIIHIFSASYLSFLITQAPIILLARMYRKKIVLNYHSGQADDHIRRSKATVTPLFNMCDRIAVQTQYLVNVFKSHGFEAVAVPNVADTSGFPFVERTKFRPRILVPRMLDPIYNCACAIRAFEIVKREIPDAQLTVIGDGADEQKLRDLVKNLGVQDVEFPGRIPRDKIADVFADHDVCLNTSDIDNMPVSLLEAMSCGLPVVTTDAGGIPFMVDHGVTGYLAPCGDHDKIAEHLLALLRDQQETQSIVQAAKLSLEQYQWPAVAPKWIALYEGLKNETN